MYKFEEKVYNAIKQEVFTAYMDAMTAGEPTEELRANYLLIRRIDKELETARINYDEEMRQRKEKKES